MVKELLYFYLIINIMLLKLYVDIKTDSLAPGKVQGEVVECPLHYWHYNIRTGELLDYMEGVKMNTYNIEIRKNEIYLDI